MAQLHGAAFTSSRAWSVEEFTALVGQTGVHALGDPFAFALIRVVAGEAELLTIATDPSHQRQGLGRALLTQCTHKAAAVGASDMFLEVAQDNHAALALYRAAGFAEVGLRQNYYRSADGTRIGAIVMRKALQAG